MRRFVGRDGRQWDAIVGKESWGTLVLLFTLAGGSDVRKSVLAAETPRAAQAELDAMGDDALGDRLDASVPW